MNVDIKTIRKVDLPYSRADIRDLNIIKLIEEWLDCDYKTFVSLISYIDNSDRVITMFDGDLSFKSFSYFNKNQDIVDVSLFKEIVNGNVNRGFTLKEADKDMQYFDHIQDEKVHIHHHIHCFRKMNFANSGYYPIYI